MLVICCGMQRAGSTLQYQLTAAVVATAGAGRAGGWITPAEFDGHLGALQQELLVFKCHAFIPAVAELVSIGRAKAVYVYRDIRDVVVSIMQKKEISFEQMLQRGSLHTVLEQDRTWCALSNMLISRYENMIANIPEEVGRIAGHLGVTLSPAQISAIGAQHTMEQQLQRIQSFDFEQSGLGQGHDRYDPNTLLHKNHIASGKPLHWMQVLSGLQAGFLEHTAGDWLQKRGYPITQNILVRTLAKLKYRRHLHDAP